MSSSASLVAYQNAFRVYEEARARAEQEPSASNEAELQRALGVYQRAYQAYESQREEGESNSQRRGLSQGREPSTDAMRALSAVRHRSPTRRTRADALNSREEASSPDKETLQAGREGPPLPPLPVISDSPLIPPMPGGIGAPFPPVPADEPPLPPREPELPSERAPLPVFPLPSAADSPSPIPASPPDEPASDPPLPFIPPALNQQTSAGRAPEIQPAAFADQLEQEQAGPPPEEDESDGPTIPTLSFEDLGRFAGMDFSSQDEEWEEDTEEGADPYPTLPPEQPSGETPPLPAQENARPPGAGETPLPAGSTDKAPLPMVGAGLTARARSGPDLAAVAEAAEKRMSSQPARRAEALLPQVRQVSTGSRKPMDDLLMRRLSIAGLICCALLIWALFFILSSGTESFTIKAFAGERGENTEVITTDGKHFQIAENQGKDMHPGAEYQCRRSGRNFLFLTSASMHSCKLRTPEGELIPLTVKVEQ